MKTLATLIALALSLGIVAVTTAPADASNYKAPLSNYGKK